MMTDPIADMLTRVRNGLAAEKIVVEMPGSNVKSAIAKVLKDEGYIKDFEQVDREGKKVLTVALKYHQGDPAIRTLKRESKPGLRVYKSCSDLPSVMGGLGVAIVSTSRGIMTDRQARAAGVGGEVLCSVS